MQTNLSVYERSALFFVQLSHLGRKVTAVAVEKHNRRAFLQAQNGANVVREIAF